MFSQEYSGARNLDNSLSYALSINENWGIFFNGKPKRAYFKLKDGPIGCKQVNAILKKIITENVDNNKSTTSFKVRHFSYL